MVKEKEDDRGVALQCELVGLKNLKMTHNWRIELDTYEVGQEKVKELIDLIGKPVSIGIVLIEE